MLLGTLAARLLGNMLLGKGKIRVGEGTIELFKIFNATSSFKKFWNTKVLSK